MIGCNRYPHVCSTPNQSGAFLQLNAKRQHVYHKPLRLCLTLPKAREWTGAMRIDQTFVPWATTWLYYFEEWLVSDEWKGGGEHPDPDSAESYNRHVRRAVR
jgi:hypothetical protein